MKALWPRLAVGFFAACLVAFAILDVAFVLWAQRQATLDRHQRLRAAAFEFLTRASQTPSDSLAAELSAYYQVAVFAVAKDGRSFGKAPVSEDVRDTIPLGHSPAQGQELFHALADETSAIERVIAAEHLADSVDNVLAGQPRVIALLVAVGVFWLLLALWLWRRLFITPLTHMTRLVDAADHDALSDFGMQSSDPLHRLSRAIVTMSGRLADDKKRINLQLRDLTQAHDDLANAQAQLLRAERLAVVGRLAAGLAHEIGNPLTVVRGYLEVFQQSENLTADETQKAVVRMQSELERIHIIVRNLLDYSRAKETAKSAGDVFVALRHVIELLAPQARFREIRVDAPPLDDALRVPVATEALTQVFLNLLLNAADALEDKGRVEITIERDEKNVTVRFADSGPGVARNLREKIFEPFYSNKPVGEGTGLGLAVCEEIVTAAEGSIRVDDSTLGGAEFSVRLPLDL